jgi:hypothetical protein
MLRHPAVAGHFYKGSPAALRAQVESYLDKAAERVKAIGILAPHAGLMYSGPVAGALYSRIELPNTIVLIGPNHTGLGTSVSLMAAGTWQTPLGEVSIDETLAAAILSKSPKIREDSLAHLREHSLEVQLPFIQYFKSDCRIVPIQMLDTRLETCIEVGRAVGEAVKDRGRGPGSGSRVNPDLERLTPVPRFPIPDSRVNVLIVASSDMTHYERAATAKDKDFRAIRHILDLDPQGLHREIRDSGITMCGFGPATAMLVAAKMLGATKAELVKYTNSGEVSGDYEQVVGYAGIIIR